MNQDPVESWLEGAVKDSSGRFSVDLIRAHHKLTKVAELEPGLILGKLLQAALLAGVTQVRLQLHSRIVQARLSLATPDAQADQVQQELTYAFALARALKPEKASWETSSGHLNLLESFAEIPVGHVCTFKLHFRGGSLWQQLKELIKSRTLFHSFVHQRLGFYPVPLFLDGVRINGSPWPKTPDWPPRQVHTVHLVDADRPLETLWTYRIPRIQLFLARLYLGKEYIHGGEGLTLVLKGPETFELDTFPVGDPSMVAVAPGKTPGTMRMWTGSHRYRAQGTTADPDQVDFFCQRWIAWKTDEEKAEIWPIRHGLLLNPIEIPWAPKGVRVVVGVHSLKVDLDQLHVIRDQEFEKLETDIRSEIEETK